MKTSQRQISLFGEDELMSSQGDFLVKTQVSPSKMVKVNRGCKVPAQAYSMKCAGLFPKSGPDTWWPKTLKIFLKLTEVQTLPRYSPNWPEWGTMQNGEFAARQMSVRPITGQGCISLLTPTASDYKRDKLSFPMYRKRHHRSAGALTEQLYRLFGAVPGQVTPPLLLLDDGFPYDVDGITVPEWRRRSIEAMGNAVVPDIPHRIFKAIENYES